MAAQYVLSMLDPFDQTISQPKILDGSVDRSSGLRLKATGTFQLDNTGAANYIVMYPGFSYALNWKTAASTPTLHTIFPNHVGTTTDRSSVKQLRLVSCGAKFSLENSSDENEGFWEAVRIPMNSSDFRLTDLVAPLGEDYGAQTQSSFSLPDLSNYNTFQSGRLKDLDRFLFKLNSTAPDHPFKRVLAGATDIGGAVAPTLVSEVLDDFFDVVVIKMIGRIDAVTPSTIRYQLISNQEVVYKENTQVSRLQTINNMLPDMDQLLNKTRFILPAVQIA